MPWAWMLAFHLNPKAQEVCAALAEKNGVSERVRVGTLFNPEDFADYADERVPSASVRNGFFSQGTCMR